MTYFKLNIPKINEKVSLYKNIRKETVEDINIAYNSLGYVQSAWNDANSNTFVDLIKNDKYKVNNYFNYLDTLYNEIYQFKENIDNICHKYGYRRNSINLKFDDNEIEECKRYLNNIIYLLNDSLNQININLFGSDFEYISLVYTLRSEIKTIKNIVNDMIVDITNFTNSINNEIYNSRFRMKRISNYNFSLKKVNYNWKIVYMNAKK